MIAFDKKPIFFLYDRSVRKDVEKLTHQWILETLKAMGLSQTSVQIYLSLAIEGPQKRKEIADALDLGKTKVNNSLKQLQGKGLINMSLGCPVIFSAVQFNQVFEALAKQDNEQASNLERNREAIISYWRNLTSNR